VEDKEAVNQVYNVAVGDRTTLNELLALLQENLARLVPDFVAAEPIHGDFRPGDVKHSQADIAKAVRLLGYRPSHRIDQGLAEAMPWYVQAVPTLGTGQR
jgi:UDP-N-acetylglucosamine 4-epimerase